MTEMAFPDQPDATLPVQIGKEDERFADLLDRPYPHGLLNVIRYDHARKRWHYWDKVRWRPDQTKQVHELLRRRLAVWMTAATTAAEIKALSLLLDHRKKESVLATLSSRPGFAMRGDEWDPYPHIIGCRNGLVNLETGEFLADEHPELLVTKVTKASWKADATAPRFERFLDEITAGDQAKARYLLRVLGYAMFGHQAEQKFWIFTGGGNNGKGVLTKVAAYVLGDYAASPPNTLYMRTRFGDPPAAGPRSDLLELQGLRLTPMSEPSGGQFADELLKAHSGDDPIRARNLHSSLWIEFRPTHTIIFSTNNPPKVEDVGKSMQRRVRVVPFTEDFSVGGRMDLKLEDKLRAEADGIFRMLVQAAVAWSAFGLEEPQSVTDASIAYIEDNDPLSEFVYDRCTVEIGSSVAAKALYDEYIAWAAGDVDLHLTLAAFGIAMGKRFRKHKKMTGWFYDGLRLKSAMEWARETSDDGTP